MMHERKKYFLTLAVITALMNTGYAGVAAAEEADSQQGGGRFRPGMWW